MAKRKQAPRKSLTSTPRTPAKKAKTRPARPAKPTGPPRLQKVLADAGVGSRRGCEEIITEGRVEVDGAVVTELGTRVDPDKQEICVDGMPVGKSKKAYFALNKPPGILCTNADPQGRMRAIDLIPSGIRLFTVGRLDKSSEGLILCTNDGELANKLTHPKYGVEKTYLVKVMGHPKREDLQQLREGMYFSDGYAKVDAIRRKKKTGPCSELEITLSEGKNREIRRLLAKLGHKVLELKRIAMGPVRLSDLPTGAYRPLSSHEVRQLEQAAAGAPSGRRRRSKRSSAAGAKKRVTKGGPRSATKSAPKKSVAKKSESKKTAIKRATKKTTRGSVRQTGRPAKKKATRGRRG